MCGYNRHSKYPLEVAVGKYVVDVSVVLHVLETNGDLSVDHELLAPTLLRSQVLNSLYADVRSGSLSDKEGLGRLARFAGMKIRYLGDKVLRRRAWQVAEELGWESTHAAEYVALTQLQADAFITMDETLARNLRGLVDIAPMTTVT